MMAIWNLLSRRSLNYNLSAFEDYRLVDGSARHKTPSAMIGREGVHILTIIAIRNGRYAHN